MVRLFGWLISCLLQRRNGEKQDVYGQHVALPTRDTFIHITSDLTPPSPNTPGLIMPLARPFLGRRRALWAFTVGVGGREEWRRGGERKEEWRKAREEGEEGKGGGRPS